MGLPCTTCARVERASEVKDVIAARSTGESGAITFGTNFFGAEGRAGADPFWDEPFSDASAGGRAEWAYSSSKLIF
jgi:hypothetical protein